MEDKFVSTVSSEDFDKALLGGLDFVKMKPDIAQLKAELGDLTNLDFDAESIVDAVNKAYNHGGGGDGSAYVDGQIVIFSSASVDGKVVII